MTGWPAVMHRQLALARGKEGRKTEIGTLEEMPKKQTYPKRVRVVHHPDD